MPQRHKGLLATALKSRGKNAGQENPQRPGGVFGQLRIGRKNAGKEPGEQKNGKPEQGAVAHTQDKLKPEGLFHPVVLPGTEVKTDNGLSALADALQRHGHKLVDAGQNGHGAHGKISTETGEAGGEADGQQTFRGHHYKGGNTKTEAGENHRSLQLQVLPAKMQIGLLSGEKPENP